MWCHGWASGWTIFLSSFFLLTLFNALDEAAQLQKHLLGEENLQIDKQEKIALGRSLAWNQLERHVKSGRVEEFRSDISRFNSNGLLNDKDSGYFEVLFAAVTSPVDGGKFLRPLLRSMCSKNIIELLIDIIDLMDLDSLLLLRKYCPIGGDHLQELLQMFPDLHVNNPLERYLLEFWDNPVALEQNQSLFQLNEVFSDHLKPLENMHKPRFNRQGISMKGDRLFKRLDRKTAIFEAQNLILFTEHMSHDSTVSIVPPLLRLVHSNQNPVKASAERTLANAHINDFPGDFSMALIVENNVHVWRRGSGTFVYIALNADADVEEVLYPLGNSFKTPSDTLKYALIPAENDGLLLYCSSTIVEQIHLHDILGAVMHVSDDFEALLMNLKMFYERFIDRAAEKAVFRVYRIDKKPVTIRSHKPQYLFQRNPRNFRILSNESSMRQTRTSEAPFCSNVENLSDFWAMWDSEASFDDDELDLSDDDQEDTLFDRRRWWFDGRDTSSKLESSGYDSSMSHGFIYHPRSSMLEDSALFTFRTDVFYNSLQHIE